MSFLNGASVTLRPVERHDLHQLAEWRNAPHLRARTREFRALTEADQERWFQRITAPDRRDFMFVVQATQGQPVGVVGLCHWEPRDRTAEIAFYIGDEQARGKGYAYEALSLLHEYGYRELGLDRIWAEVYAFNDESVRLLERLGYQREGLLRQHVFRGGERVDSAILGLLRDEWRPAPVTRSQARALVDQG